MSGKSVIEMPPRRTPEQHLEHDADELEERIERLDAHLQDAQRKRDAAARVSGTAAAEPDEGDDAG